MKKLFTLILSAAVALAAFTGCTEEEVPPLTIPESILTKEPTEPVTLRVITEQGAQGYIPTRESELVSAVESVAAYYQSVHANVTIEVKTLPTTEKAREAALEKLRGEIKAGKGPDIYLLPCGDLRPPEDYLENAELYRAMNNPYPIDVARMPALIQDVEISKRKGAFADITSFYDKDEALNKDELNQKVMDAGLYDGKRYVLPLGYTIPVVYADRKKAEEVGLDLNDVENGGKGGINTLDLRVGDALQWTTDFGMTSIADIETLSLFTSLYGYDGQSLMPDEIDLTQMIYKFFFSVLRSRYRQPESSCDTVKGYLEGEEYYLKSDWTFKVAGLGGAAERVGLGKYLGLDLHTFPLTTLEEALIATITYYGAVDSHCENSELAYDFLRLFLFPNVQFGQGLGEEYPTKLTVAAQAGWPVRTAGSVQAMWRQAVSVDDPADERLLKKIASTKLSDEDIPLQKEIYEVRFPNGLSTLFSTALRRTEEYDFGHTPNEGEALGVELLAEMKEYMAEMWESAERN